MEVSYKKPHIFIISGKARHGKHTVAKMLVDKYTQLGKRCAITIYAKYIKDYAREYFGWDGNEEDKPRQLLELLGENIIKEHLKDKDFQLRRTIEDMQVLAYFFDVIIVADARFVDEIEEPKKVFEHVTTIRVERPNFDNQLEPPLKNHITETALDDYQDWDYKINNTTREELEHQIKQIVNEVK